MANVTTITFCSNQWDKVPQYSGLCGVRRSSSIWNQVARRNEWTQDSRFFAFMNGYRPSAPASSTKSPPMHQHELFRLRYLCMEDYESLWKNCMHLNIATRKYPELFEFPVINWFSKTMLQLICESWASMIFACLSHECMHLNVEIEYHSERLPAVNYYFRYVFRVLFLDVTKVECMIHRSIDA